MLYAIVDIETTGGFSGNNRMTEIAVCLHDGEKVVEEYQTLLNPERSIPGFITGLTGIDQEMVSKAPTFKEIAHELLELLEGNVFVAHNVNFDYTFVREEFRRVGLTFHPQRLCTVRLSRQIFPGLRSYSLGRICEHLQIRISDRHRAFGDAAATAILFGKLMESGEDFILKSLKKNNGEVFLPPNISKEKYRELPEAAGVYYFHDMHGKVIYVGKAINIKSRFKGHFTGNSQGGIKLQLKSDIHDVSWELTGSEFLALLLEALEIKRLWPKYNRSLKSPNHSWGLFVYEDSQGYQRLQASRLVPQAFPVYGFRNHAEARAFMAEKIQYYNLCPKLCGVQKSIGACFDFQIGKCSGACKGIESISVYNAKVRQLLTDLENQKSKILIRESGRNEDEQAVILFEDGVLQGYGFVPGEADINQTEAVLDFIKPVKAISETGYILRSFITTLSPNKISVLST